MPEDESYQGWANWDTWETMLLLENTESTYRWLQEWKKNFEKKKAKGTFNQSMAESVVHKYLVPVARGKGMAKRFSGFQGDPEIDPKKVNAKEIIEKILSE
jgi:hypothetical protein